MLTTHSTYSANQAEHLESLLLSHLSMTHANYAKAVAALHAKLLQPFERWCAHTAVVDGEAEVRPELGRTNAWLRPDTPELLREIGLYLLLWGEAANLRFMPEMLCFLFELARSSSAIQSLRLQTFKGAPAATAAATAAAAAAATAPTAGQRRPREEESEEEEELEPGLVLSKSEFQRLLAIDRARRNPARLLFDHARPKGLVISICDADFTYFEWGAPEDEDEEDTTPTRWYAEVRSAAQLMPTATHWSAGNL